MKEYSMKAIIQSGIGDIDTMYIADSKKVGQFVSLQEGMKDISILEIASLIIRIF